MDIGQFKKVYNQWLEDNPLRKFRKGSKSKLKLHELAAMLGVSGYTIQRWESGMFKPNEESMEKLKRIIGEHVESEWNIWWSSKPEL
jgi:DNA-binding transcriptional regulator YiaG